MKRNSFIALVALLVAAVGVIIGLAAYFKNRSSYLYEEDDDYLFNDPDELDYYTPDEEDDYAEPAPVEIEVIDTAPASEMDETTETAEEEK